MQFLSDGYIRCAECGGRRYRPHILNVRLAAPAGQSGAAVDTGRGRSAAGAEGWSIGDVLDATAEEVTQWLSGLPDGLPKAKAMKGLELLVRVGLGYLPLGQPLSTLSGGESQRLKLVAHLAEFERGGGGTRPTLFIFDEPTTGLHFEDI